MKKIPCIECDDKLLEYVKPFLIKWGYHITNAVQFDSFPYLALNCDGMLGVCTSITSIRLTNYDRELITDVEEFLERAAELKGFTYKKKQKDMKLSDLKPGMIVKTKKEEKFLVLFINNEMIFSSINNYIDSSSYNEDLTCKSFSDLTIVEVFVPVIKTSLLELLTSNYSFLESIWKREEILEVTMEEVAKKFGVKEIKIKQ